MTVAFFADLFYVIVLAEDYETLIDLHLCVYAYS